MDLNKKCAGKSPARVWYKWVAFNQAFGLIRWHPQGWRGLFNQKEVKDNGKRSREKSQRRVQKQGTARATGVVDGKQE